MLANAPRVRKGIIASLAQHLYGCCFAKRSKKWCPRQDLNLSDPFVRFRDDDHRPINRGDSALLQFSIHAVFYAVSQLSSHQLSSATPVARKIRPAPAAPRRP